MRPRIILIIIGILIVVTSIIPLLGQIDITISGFNIAEEIEDSFPRSHNLYFIIILALGLFATIIGLKSRKIVY